MGYLEMPISSLSCLKLLETTGCMVLIRRNDLFPAIYVEVISGVILPKKIKHG